MDQQIAAVLDTSETDTAPRTRRDGSRAGTLGSSGVQPL